MTLLEAGAFGTAAEIAEAEKINMSYVSRILRLTLLAPEIIEAILDGRQSAEMTLAVLMEPFPVGWREQADCSDWLPPTALEGTALTNRARLLIGGINGSTCAHSSSVRSLGYRNLLRS